MLLVVDAERFVNLEVPGCNVERFTTHLGVQSRDQTHLQ